MVRGLLLCCSLTIASVGFANKPEMKPATATPATAAPTQQMTCGQMMAEKSKLPKKFAELMTQVSANMEAHAKQMATFKKDKAAQAEAKKLKMLAKGHAEMGKIAAKMAMEMESMKDMASSPEAEKPTDMAAMMEMMTKTNMLEKEFGMMVTESAKQGEAMIKQMKAAK